MIDQRDRVTPRFPASKEDEVRKQIRDHILKHKLNNNYDLLGIASGACGGDIIFHEECKQLGIPTEIYLSASPEEFKKKSVSFANSNWNERFDKLIKELPVHVLPKNYKTGTANIYESTNEWILHTILSFGGENVMLMALWDGQEGDGHGGAAHMVAIAKSQNTTVDIIDINKILLI